MALIEWSGFFGPRESAAVTSILCANSQGLSVVTHAMVKDRVRQYKGDRSADASLIDTEPDKVVLTRSSDL